MDSLKNNRLFYCDYEEITGDDVFSTLKKLSTEFFIPSDKNPKREINPIIIGSKALSKYYKISTNDIDIIMTPLEAYKMINKQKESITSINIYILNCVTRFYYKLLYSSSEGNFDITLITNSNSGCYKLALYCQKKSNKNIFGTKMIFADQDVLKMLKSVHLYYDSDFEKHIKHFNLMGGIHYTNNDELMSIRKILINEATTVRGPINSLEDYDKSLSECPIISYQIDKYLLPKVTDDFVESYRNSLRKFCTSKNGKKYWGCYYYMFHTIPNDKIMMDYEKAKIKRNPYEFYFEAHEVEKAKSDANSAIFHDDIFAITLDSVQYIIWFEKSSLNFDLKIKIDDIEYKLINIKKSQPVVKVLSSSESQSIVSFVVDRHKPKCINDNQMIYLLKLASIQMTVDLSNVLEGSEFIRGVNEHPIVTIYKGITSKYNYSQHDDWKYEFTTWRWR